MPEPVDVALIGGGIMSATLGALISELEPDWSVTILEGLGDVALESSNAWNNAGTGHAALCELNYSPERPDGTVDVSKAIDINEQFQVSRQFWSFLVEQGVIPEPQRFINSVPHLSFVWGEDNVAYLRKRFDALKDHPLFAGLEYTEDARKIREWAPLLIPGRAKSQPVAATRITSGTDVDFGALTHDLIDHLVKRGADLRLNYRVTGLKKKGGVWRIRGRREVGLTSFELNARFVFVGAGGGALTLLQRSGIREIRGYGGFPISGQFLRTDEPSVVAKHQGKVYGKASVGAPPMSVPHLDTRVVDGSKSLLFGPYAGFSPKFLKTGTWWDLFGSIRWHNLGTMVGAGLRNLGLVKYLVGELLASRAAKHRVLQEFAPTAKRGDWRLITAGQRVQIMKRDANGTPVIQLGTEVVAAADGSIAGLLGASPGASTAVPIMLGLLERCFPEKFEGWRPGLQAMVPSLGDKLSADEKAAKASLTATATKLELSSPA